MDTYQQDNLKLYNADCMDIMKEYEDNYFDLAVVDPPYGSGNINGGYTSGKGGTRGAGKQKDYNLKLWAMCKPPKEYFQELMRVSKNQVIWGANHFISEMPLDSPCWVVWDKQNENTGFADCELAWCSFNKAVRKFVFTWNGMLQGDMKNKEKRIHPTQKPVKLYDWIYSNYTKEPCKILDTHLGSGSNAIAAHYAKMAEFVGVELDKDYFKASTERIYKETRQQEMF